MAISSSFSPVKEARMHVHIYSGNGEAKYWLEPNVALAANYGLNQKELNDIERIIGERRHEIIERWKQHHSGR
jgi:hypothetical protein